MNSFAKNHFPQFVFRNGKKMLWNPVEKKPLANRPEERVRLRVIDFLMLDAGWSKNRISTETGLNDAKRTDIICYAKNMNPHILVECKAESVPLNEKAASQIAGYNRKVHAPYLLITNSVTDFWFHVDADSIQQLEKPPLEISETGDYRNEFNYWSSRGFCGDKAWVDLKNWLQKVLPRFWADSEEHHNKYLDIQHHPDNLSPNHYYHIFGSDEESRTAIGFLGSETGETWLVSILNHNQQTAAISITNLDQTINGIPENTRLFTTNRTSSIDIRKHIPFSFKQINYHVIENLQGFFNSYFKKLV